MLDIDTKYKEDKNQVQIPIYFERKNICPCCGATGTLIFVDSMGRETKKEIYPFDHIKCKACGQNYAIYWQMDEETKKMFPSAIDPLFKKDFLNNK